MSRDSIINVFLCLVIVGLILNSCQKDFGVFEEKLDKPADHSVLVEKLANNQLFRERHSALQNVKMELLAISSEVIDYMANNPNITKEQKKNLFKTNKQKQLDYLTSIGKTIASMESIVSQIIELKTLSKQELELIIDASTDQLSKMGIRERWCLSGVGGYSPLYDPSCADGACDSYASCRVPCIGYDISTTEGRNAYEACIRPCIRAFWCTMLSNCAINSLPEIPEICNPDPEDPNSW
jgi:hypothetical protein